MSSRLLRTALVRALEPAHEMPPLLLSRRRTARLLGTRPVTVAELIRRGLLSEVPCGAARRIPREDVERLAREGWTLDSAPRRRTSRRRPGTCDPDALRALDLDTLTAQRAP